MAKNVLVIDRDISSWSYSKQLVRNFLNSAGKGPVEVQLSSLGGEVDHAIDIYNQFREHGEVTVIMSAMNASSSTLIALGGKKVIMHSNSFYLIHKPMSVVGVYSNMNADEIDAFIARLDKAKQFLEKLTMEMVKMYMVKSGKSSNEILDLMKESKWLNAKEAKEWGFVDEIIEPDVATNWLEDEKMIAMITGNEMPLPVMSTQKPVEQAEPVQIITDQVVDSFWTRIVDRITALINPPTHKKAEMKIFALVNKCLGVTALESSDDKGVYLNEVQLQAINDQLATVDRANLDRQQAETALNDAHTALDVIDATVAAAQTTAEKVTAIKAVIASKPGTVPAAPKPKSDPVQDTTNWDVINNLPHNQDYDKNN